MDIPGLDLKILPLPLPFFGSTRFQGFGSTFPKTNSLHVKIGRAPKGNSSFNHPFSGAKMLVDKYHP